MKILQCNILAADDAREEGKSLEFRHRISLLNI
jgi:hypothetical protein